MTQSTYSSSPAFIDHFSALEDPRQQWKVVYPLNEILLLVLSAVLSGADDFVEICEWGKSHIDFLKTHYPYKDGIPSHDAVNDLINALDPELFADCFVSWINTLRKDDIDIIALDGKTSRRSGDKAKGKNPLHLVSAWASQQRLVLGQQACEEKSNEIKAIPELLERLSIAGALVTIDAMGCQKDIARKIIGKGGDYLLGLKRNHPKFYDDVERFFNQPSEEKAIQVFEETQRNHGRTETRRHLISCQIDTLKTQHNWDGLSAIGCIETKVERDGEIVSERRYYIASLAMGAKAFANAVRAHWGIENQLHWVLDVVFHDDLSRLRTGFGPQNMAVIRHMALNIIRNATDKASQKVRRKKAAWSTDYLQDLLSGKA